MARSFYQRHDAILFMVQLRKASQMNKRITVCCFAAVIGIVLTVSIFNGVRGIVNTDKLNTYIVNGQNEEAIALIEKGIDLNKKNDLADRICSKMTDGMVAFPLPLYMACHAGNTEMIHYLLDQGADPNITNYGYSYPLEEYLRNNYNLDASVVSHMIEAGVDVTQGRYDTPMFALIERYNRIKSEESKKCLQDEVIYLIDAGANWEAGKVDIKNEGYTILHWVAPSEDTDFMIKLLTYEQSKDCINVRDKKWGNTPLDLAREYNKTEMEQLLLEAVK